MEDIKTWLTGDRDFKKGVALYEKHAKNSFLLNRFKKDGGKNCAWQLAFELSKIAGVKMTTQKAQQPKTEANNKNGEDVPRTILLAKKEIAALYAKIDEMHTQLYEIGTSNNKRDVAKRQKILEYRLPLCVKVDELYQLKEDYFKAKGQAQANILKKIEYILEEAKEEKKRKKEQVKWVTTLSDVDLLKRRQYLRSVVTKTQNMLNYQSITKLEELAPMPEGPKREKTENNLKRYKKELAEIEEEIKKR